MPIIRNFRTIAPEPVPQLPTQPRVDSPLDDLNMRSEFKPRNANRYRPKGLLSWFKTDLDRGFKIEVNQPLSPSAWSKTQLDIEGAVAAYKPAPFENWRTDLTYLKFGQDQPGGGSSRQPYVAFQIPGPKLPRLHPSAIGLRTNQYVRGRVFLGQNEPTPPEIAQYYLSNRTNGDFPARGGGVSYQIGSQTYTLSSQIDKSRIAAFLSDKPRGDLFVRKQQGLQLSNPQMETGKSISMSSQFSPLPGILENTRTYNVSNTLFQVGVAGTGFHAIRAGNSPLDSGNNFYAGTVGRQSLMDSQQVQGANRLLVLANMKLTNGAGFSSVQGNNAFNATSNTIRAASTIANSGISLNNQAIMDYAGGPGSAYGIGNTTIRRNSNTAEEATAPSKIGSAKVMSYEQLASQNANNTTNGTRTTNIQDFSTGEKLTSREDVYKLTTKNSMDAIANEMQKKTSTDPWASAQPDLIKFGFEFINNDTPENALFVQFRAYLNNGFSDSNSAMYNTFKYLGRGEDFYVYQGFSRTISFGFRIVLEGSKDAEYLYGKLSTLITQVYPDYSAGTNIMRAPLTRITIGDYVYRLPGFIESVDVTADQESPWGPSPVGIAARAANGFYSFGEAEVPHYVNVQIQFKPIFDALPKRDNGNGRLDAILQRMRNETDRMNAQQNLPAAQESARQAMQNISNIQVPSTMDALNAAGAFKTRDQLLRSNQLNQFPSAITTNQTSVNTLNTRG